MKMIRWSILLGLSVLLGACEQRRLYDVNDGHYIRVYIDEKIRNVTYGFYDREFELPSCPCPSVLRVILFDEEGREVSERYLYHKDKDEGGTYFDGYLRACSGTYHLMIYNADTESTFVSDGDSFYEMFAYTPVVRRRRAVQQDSYYTPEHLFVCRCEHYPIRSGSAVDTLRTPEGAYFKASTIVSTYFLHRKVRGAQWVRSVRGYLVGMSGAEYLHDGLLHGESKQLVWNLELKDFAPKNDEAPHEGVLFATFNTFGIDPQISAPVFRVELRLTDGSVQSDTVDMSAYFASENCRLRQWLLIDGELVVDKPDNPIGDGGFVPDVDEWEDVETDIEF